MNPLIHHREGQTEIGDNPSKPPDSAINSATPPLRPRRRQSRVEPAPVHQSRLQQQRTRPLPCATPGNRIIPRHYTSNWQSTPRRTKENRPPAPRVFIPADNTPNQPYRRPPAQRGVAFQSGCVASPPSQRNQQPGYRPVSRPRTVKKRPLKKAAPRQNQPQSAQATPTQQPPPKTP